MSVASADVVIKTNKKGGADAEVREEIWLYDFVPPISHPKLDPNGRRGGQTEIATRVQSLVPAANETVPSPAIRTDRSSHFYLRFNIRGITAAQVLASPSVDLRLTYHSNNLNQSQETAANNSQGRLKYTYDPPPGGGANFDDTSKLDDNGDEETRKAGFNYYALNPGHPANTPAGKFIENPANLSGISYWTAPGLLPDGNIGTIDIDPAQTTFLGNKKLPDIGTQNRLPIGGEFLFDMPSLKAHLLAAIAAGDTYINVLVATDFDGNSNFTQFQNFNYIFNPKDKLTLNTDTGYDSDVTNPNNPLGAPFSGASNATGNFSPQLILRGVTPEPSSLALFGLGALASLSVARRRRD
jgi:hypothetical protein